MKLREFLYYKKKIFQYYWNAYEGYLLVILAAFIVFSIAFFNIERGPWYLGCADRHGNEMLLKTNKKPRTQGSLVFLEDDVFVTPEPGMTCRIVSVKKIDEENSAKTLDNPI